MNIKFWEYMRKFKPKGMQSTVMLAFSLISISIMLILGVVMYIKFSALSQREMIQDTEMSMEQTRERLEEYLIAMRQISDTVYYNVIKEKDLSSQDNKIQQGMNIIYEANRSHLRSIAIYNEYGSLLAAEPVASQKEDPDVIHQSWFEKAMEAVENMHFSTPHIQNLFDDATRRYYWVISLSRVVDLTDKGTPVPGVLLVDMDFSGVSRMLQRINSNTSDSGQYFYLCDSNGEIIYHKKQMQISSGSFRENNVVAATYKDGVYGEKFGGEHRKLIIKTVSYTGWKLVGVIPDSTFTQGMFDIRYFIIMIILLMAMMLAVINRVVSVRISSPILKLDDSVREYEAGEKPEIYIGGSQEIRHLGNSIQRSYEQIDRLMQEIVKEQNERRKSELDALQSQINPHFLYNALDSITWMIEGERNDDAVYMISELAKLFRISLSRGQTIIRVQDELQHAKSYMNIQKIRYKNAFSVVFDVEPVVYTYCSVKLVLQPLLENAISYGVSGMDELGEIRVVARKQGERIILSVEDNGLGMSEEEAELVLTDSDRIHKRGSGVGLINVNNRIQMLFGKEYGLVVESEPDEGTTVSICIPAVPYTDENRRILEKGFMFGADEINNREIQDK
ncbi:MAG: sensor histidine kinase [Eubacterium sp.]|nr:sensor histidine kinase [Eubacterium sp.]